MPDRDTLDERLAAVERALADTDRDELPDLETEAELAETTTNLEARLTEVETRLDELASAVQAVRGYVGNVRSVNDAVERRADAALAKAESVEDALADERDTRDGPGHCDGPDNRDASDIPGDTSGIPDVSESSDEADRFRFRSLLGRVREAL